MSQAQVGLVRDGMLHASHRLEEIAGRLNGLSARVLSLAQRVFYTLADADAPEAVAARSRIGAAEIAMGEAPQAARAAAQRLLDQAHRL